MKRTNTLPTIKMTAEVKPHTTESASLKARLASRDFGNPCIGCNGIGCCY